MLALLTEMEKQGSDFPPPPLLADEMYQTVDGKTRDVRQERTANPELRGVQGGSALIAHPTALGGLQATGPGGVPRRSPEEFLCCEERDESLRRLMTLELAGWSPREERAVVFTGFPWSTHHNPHMQGDHLWPGKDGPKNTDSFHKQTGKPQCHGHPCTQKGWHSGGKLVAKLSPENMCL